MRFHHGRWRTLACAVALVLALGGCTEAEPEAGSEVTEPGQSSAAQMPALAARAEWNPTLTWETALAETRAKGSPLPILEPGEPLPTDVELPGLAFPDLPELAPVLTEPLPPTPIDGLEIYPVFTDGPRQDEARYTYEEFDTFMQVGFINAQGEMVAWPSYYDYWICLGPEGRALAVLGSARSHDDLLDPATGEVMWTTSEYWVNCVPGTRFAEVGGGVLDLETLDFVVNPDTVEASFGSEFVWIDSHTVDIPDDGRFSGVILDLDTGERIRHEGVVVAWDRSREWYNGWKSRRTPPVDYSRSASLPVEVSWKIMNRYMSWDGQWVSEAFAGDIGWYNEKVIAISVRAAKRTRHTQLVDRQGTVLAESKEEIMRPIGNDLLWVCLKKNKSKCKEGGVIRTDGSWLIEPGIARGLEFADSGFDPDEDIDNHLTGIVVKHPGGEWDAVSLPSGSSTPLPIPEKGLAWSLDRRSGCLSLYSHRRFRADQASSGFLRDDGRIVMLPYPYWAAGTVETEPALGGTNGFVANWGCEVADTRNEGGFTSDGLRLPDGVSIKHNFGPGLYWATWGRHSGYLSLDGGWLYRYPAHAHLED
ncbi:MAG: hypothetical protein FWD59_08890 [Micrococcales bacterium]|nr:hypothetical protein [Micrococcales bacterium]